MEVKLITLTILFSLVAAATVFVEKDTKLIIMVSSLLYYFKVEYQGMRHGNRNPGNFLPEYLTGKWGKEGESMLTKVSVFLKIINI